MAKTQLDKDLFYYGDYLELIASFSLSRQLTLKDLGDTDEDKAVIQKCYRDMKREKFEGTVIDYLCWISTQFIFDAWQAKGGRDENIHNAAIYIKKLGIEFVGEGIEDKNAKEWISAVMVGFLMAGHTFRDHSRNMVRLFHKTPELIIKIGLNFKYYFNNIRTVLNIFNWMNILSCYEFLSERLIVKDKKSEDKLWRYILAYAVEAIIIRKIGIEGSKFTKDLKFNELITG